jgi:hypothetical protein
MIIRLYYHRFSYRLLPPNPEPMIYGYFLGLPRVNPYVVSIYFN